MKPLGELSSLVVSSIFRLLPTAWVIVSTKNIGSSNWPSLLFWASRLFICEACWLILFCLCLEFFHNLHSPASSEMTHEETSTAAIWEPVCLNLLQPLKVIARQPQNWVKLSVLSNDCSILCAIAALYWSFNLWEYWLLSCSLTSILNSSFLAMILWTSTWRSSANTSSDSFFFWAQL